MSRWGGAGAGDHGDRVIIDPEMGAFGDNGCIDFIKTEWDTQLDKGSLLPGIVRGSLHRIVAQNFLA